MDNPHTEKKSLKQKLRAELAEYIVNFIYIAVILSAILLYRRLLLEDYGIFLKDYFIGVIKAFVIAKVVMIGAFFGISRKFENRPLLIPIVYKAFFFTVLIMIFDLLEFFIVELFHNHDLIMSIKGIDNHINLVWLSASLLIFFIFIPFFGMKELIRVLGRTTVLALLLKKREL